MELINITSFNETDWILVALAVILIGVGISRGFVKALIALILWLAVLTSSQVIAGILQKPLGRYVTDPELLLLLPFALIFFFLFVFLRIIVSFVMLSYPNVTTVPLTRAIGGILSLPLLAVQSIFIVQIVRLLTLDESAYWQNSRLTPYLEQWELYWANSVLQKICDVLWGGLCVL